MRESAERCLDIAKGLEMSEQAIRALATNYLPTLSRLVGPLGAAKLCVLAGGRERLARMPSGSIQVLGAHAAMAAHRRGAPPPKHGSVIFSMPQVSRSPRRFRGKIAMYLAGKASIASRIDHFDGTPWSDNEIADIHKKSEEIRSRFSLPPEKVRLFHGQVTFHRMGNTKEGGSLWTRNAVRGVSVAGERRKRDGRNEWRRGCPQVKGRGNPSMQIKPPADTCHWSGLCLSRIFKRYDGKSFA